LIGIVQTFAVGVDASIATTLRSIGWAVGPETFGYTLWKLKISQIAPVLPYVLLVLILIFRPKGLLGTREG
jgi:branched-chain amino acid transport system permease protein